MNYFALISLLIQHAGTLKTIFTKSSTNANVFDKIEEIAPAAIEVLRSIGNQLFPDATPEIQVVGTMAAFDKTYVLWLQKNLNTIANAELTVDGIYGKMTRDAVTNFQENNGLLVDGVAGKATQAKIKELIS